MADIDGDTAQETAGLPGGDAAAVRMDVTKAADIEAGVQEAVAAFGGVDIVVNNAGTRRP